MFDAESIDAKILLVEYRDLLDEKIKEKAAIKDNSDFLNWFNENKEDLKRLISIRSIIFYLLDNNIEKFTVDEDTYELALAFINDYIEDIDYVLKSDDENVLFLSSSNSQDLPEENQELTVNVAKELLLKTKTRYLGYIDKLEEHLPKC